MAELKITLEHSVIGHLQNRYAAVKALGLGKMNSTVTKPTDEVIKGMINTTSHLVDIEEV